MKIGIVGLLADQVNTIRAAYPQHALEFLDRERERETRDFAARCSKVALMTKFISHSTSNAVPAHKRVMINGGLTKLRVWLNTQATAPITTIHKHVTKEPIMTAPESSKVDYKLLLAAAIGETVEFKRPAKTTIAKWETQIHSARSYYRRHHGIQTEVAYKDGVAALTIVDRASKEKKVVGQTVQQTTPSGGEGDRQFWQQVLLARLNAAMPIESAIRDADTALDLSRQKFGAN